LLSSIALTVITFLLLSYFGASNGNKIDGSLLNISQDVLGMCYLTSLPTLAGSAVGLIMLDEPSEIEVNGLIISRFNLTSIMGAFAGVVVLIPVTCLNAIRSIPDFTFNLGSLTLLILFTVFLGTPLGALGSSSTVARRYSRNLIIAGLGTMVLFAYNENQRPYSLIYLMISPCLIASIVGFGIRLSRFNLQQIGYSKSSIFLVLLSSACVGICLGIWIKSRILNLLSASLAFFGFSILLFFLYTYRK
jgi:hypothetical protein